MKLRIALVLGVCLLANSALFSQPVSADYAEQMRAFQGALRTIKMYYVQDVDSEDLIYRAIDSMLEQLDPHSNFLDAAAAKRLAEEHRGSFGGLGIVITIRNDVLTVSALINDRTPGALAGLLPGDQIIKIEGESTEGITTSEAAQKMRGPIGTKVTITVKRAGVDEPIDFTITRGNIPVDTVPYAFMVAPGIGYLRLERFTQKAIHEFNKYVKELEDAGMESLILDLRGNPGGYLEQAFGIAEQFIGDQGVIVETRGRIPRSTRKYRSRRAQPLRKYPVVVLVNEGSASASEIVAGALQDWDRGLVVGETTFGKGLVQRVFTARTPPYPITACDGCQLKLTTARYYTPSGRCIQKPYEGLDIFNYRHERITDTKDRPKYQTMHGRTVYGGGGISPDVEVKMDKLSKVSSILRSRNAFRLFVQYYYEHIQPLANLTEVPSVDSTLQQHFLTYLETEAIRVEPEDVKEDWDYIQHALSYELTLEYWSKKGTDYHHARQEAYKQLIPVDTQLAKAIELAPNAEDLLAQW
ncbi:MAG: S41 family peptidase [Gemmatimonadetes bacterium]|nr:MAG: S41 family peptidase [Gemmatimonadota bacterium]